MSIQATTGTANISLSAMSSLKPTQGSAAQEATETPAVTKQEAAKGDQQAIRKLAMQQQQNPAPKEPGVGTLLNLQA